MPAEGVQSGRLRRWWESRSLRAAAQAFTAKGPFPRYPGAALYVDAKGKILYANDRSRDIAEAVASGHEALLSALTQVIDGGEAATVMLAPPATRATWAVTVLPVDTGDAERHALLLGRDASLERNLRGALTDSRQRYKDLVEVSSDFAWETDAQGKFAFVSPRGALGYRAEELVGRDPREILADPEKDDVGNSFQTRIAREDVTVWARRADGRAACLLVSCRPIGNAESWIGARGVCRDVTEERERDAALARARARENLLAYIIRQIRDEIVPQHMMRAAADAIANALGATGCRICRLTDQGFKIEAESGTLPPRPAPPLERLADERERFHDEAEGWRLTTVATRYRRAVNGAVAVWRDSSGADWDHEDLVLLDEAANQIGVALEQVANHENLERLSRTDTLTGLLNRRVFFDEVGKAMARVERSGRSGALCYVDLDHFKQVNDRLGHQQGDKVLLAVANLLRDDARANDLVARLGGDEFALWLDATDAEGASAKANAILAAAQSLRKYSGDADHPLGCSIGIAVCEPGRQERVEQIAARADEAMYDVKRAGRGQFRIARPAEIGPPEETAQSGVMR